MKQTKILYVSTVPSFFLSFLLPLINSVDKFGGSIILCSNFRELSQKQLGNYDELQVNFQRGAVNFEYINLLRQIKNHLNQQTFDLIQTQTPIASALIRIVNQSRVPLIYAGHGFHFHKNSSIMNWLLYFPVEWYLSKFTNVLITTNKEDYLLANKCFKAKRTELIYGVGVDFTRFHQSFDPNYLHLLLGIDSSKKIITSVGELNNNKNHTMIIDFLNTTQELKDVHFVICGEGTYRDKLSRLIKKYRLTDRVHLLGHRLDIPQILASSDLFVFPSKREGFGMALLEALLSGLDFVAFDIRGINDLVPTEIHENHLASAYNKKEFLKLVVNKIQHPQKFDYHKHMDWLNQFSVETVNERYLQIYEELLARDTNE